MSITTSGVRYDAPPTVSNFMRSDSFVRLILGPVGSGKTTGVLFEIVRRAAEQRPGRDGIRRTRWAIVRNTLAQMKTTVLREIDTWLSSITEFKVSESLVTLRVGDIHAELFLIPLEEPEDQKRLLSMQLTGVWVNEFSELDPSLIGPMAGRVGRYPSAADGGATWFGILGDSNMPNEGSEWHRLLDVETPPEWEVFVQPGGLEANAENLNWLTQTPETLVLPIDHPLRLAQGRRYYERLVASQGALWAKRYVHAQFGNDPEGTAVFSVSFAKPFHVVKGLKLTTPAPESGDAPEYEGGIQPVKGKTLIVGQDFGRNPCAIIGQVDHKGRFLALEEVVSEDMGLEAHILRNLRPTLLQPRYAGMPVLVVGDPAGQAKGTIGEETSFDVLRRYNLACQPAPTNALDARLRAVETFLLAQIGGEPMFKVDEARCPFLLRAMMGLYRYGKTKAGQTKPLPDKSNPWSDLADALQYACLGASPNMQTVVARVVGRYYGTGAPQVTHRPPPSRRAWT